MSTTTRHRSYIKRAGRYKAIGSAMLSLLFMAQAHAQHYPTRENQVKAVFLFNFTQFIEWPSNAFTSHESPFIIGVLGNDPFGNYLEETVKGEKMMNHPLTVQHYKDLRELQRCHLLFIAYSDPQKIREALDALRGRKTLTVSDSDNFAEEGGMIRFFTQDNKIKLQINLTTAKAADLNISSKLLRVSEIIE